MKRQICILVQFFLLLALSACGITSPASSLTATLKPSRLPDQNLVKALLVKAVDEEQRVPGIVVGMIADDPQERWVVGYGRLSAADARVPDGDTVFEIGSITKVFTGTLLAQAVVNGEVKLDDPISMYLPEGITAPEYEGRPITLLDLATHTAGLPRDAINPNSSTIDQMYAYLSRYRLTRAPGSTYEYSNYGFSLLGNLLARRAGQADYEALLLDRITRPLGMDSTRIKLTPDMESRLAAPHISYSVLTSSINWPVFAGAGMIRSTANELLTFLAANMGMTGTALQPALQLANAPQRQVKIYDIGYFVDTMGLGWMLAPTDIGTIHFHGGSTDGYQTFLAWDPELKIGLVVLANAKVDIQDVGSFLLTESARLMDQPVLVDPQVLARYAGRYQFPDGFVVTIRVDGTRIFTQAPNKPEYELMAISENHFHLLVFGIEITFYTNENGEVDRLVLAENGVTSEAKKVP